jgi:hypothetical protein
MDWIIISLIGVVIAVPVFDFLTWIIISVFFYHVNPLASEKGRVGTYLSIKQYSNSNKMIGGLDISFDELFGLTTNTTLQFERDSLFRQLKDKDKQLQNMKEQIKELMDKKVV